MVVYDWVGRKINLGGTAGADIALVPWRGIGAFFIAAGQVLDKGVWWIWAGIGGVENEAR